MTTEIRTLVGLRVNTSNLAIQSSSFNLNTEYLKLKATASVNNDLVAVTKIMPEIRCETHDLKGVLNLTNNTLYSVRDVSLYLGRIASLPTGNNYFDSTGVLSFFMNDGLLYIDSITANINEPVSVSLGIRGGLVDASSINLSNFTISHTSVVTPLNMTFSGNDYPLRSMTINTNFNFYDHYETGITPSLSAITGTDLAVSLEMNAHDALAISEAAAQGCYNLVVNLIKYRPCGQDPVSAGSITLGNALIKIDSLEARLGDLANGTLTVSPETITFSVT